MGFSIGQLVVAIGVGSWAFGPKELPKVAKALGRLTGRATGLLYKTRSQLSQFAEKNELNKVQEEVRATMHQLHAIQTELRHGVNILDPGPLTRRVISQIDAIPDDPIDKKTTHNTFDMPNPTTKTQLHSITDEKYNNAKNIIDDSMVIPKTQLHSITDEKYTNAKNIIDDSMVIPISADQAGLIPNRNGVIPTGSQLLADALQEERVADHALLFLNRHDMGDGDDSATKNRRKEKDR